MRKLKRLLMMFLLLPVMPVLGIPEGGDDGGGSDGGDDGGKGDAGGEDKGDDGKEAGDDGDDGKDDDKTFTQKELDSIISRRLARERKNWEKEAEDKKKKESMTETERLKAEKEEAEKKAQAIADKANQTLIKASVMVEATNLNIVDPEAAFALMNKDDVEVDDKGNVVGVKEALEALVKEKQYLVKSGDGGASKLGDDQGKDKGGKGGFSMNDLIRKAAGRQ